MNFSEILGRGRLIQHQQAGKHIRESDLTFTRTPARPGSAGRIHWGLPFVSGPKLIISLGTGEVQGVSPRNISQKKSLFLPRKFLCLSSLPCGGMTQERGYPRYANCFRVGDHEEGAFRKHS